MKSDFIIALTQLAAERNLSKEIVISAIEAALVSAYRRDSIMGGQNISVTLDPGSGDVSVYVVKTVVEEVEDPQQEITLTEARAIKPKAEVGDIVPTESLPHSAGRIAAQTAKQVVIQRLREAERELVFDEYADKEGEVYTVTVQRLEPKQFIVELGRAEAILPAAEQAPYERYRVGQKMKVLLQSVRRSNKGPELIVSRADNLLVKRLFEMEVPEIYNGAVEIKAIAREAGFRSKVAVWARQDGVDAVGSCVGLRGIRIQNIVNELHGEKIDVVQWSKDPATFISNSLSPSLVMRVELDPETQSAVAVVPERQLSLAIGKEGQNARLAARLTGWSVDIKSNVEADAEAAKEPAAPAAVAEKVPTLVEEQVAEVVEAAMEAADARAEAAAEAEPVAEVPVEEAVEAEVAEEVEAAAAPIADEAVQEPVAEQEAVEVAAGVAPVAEEASAEEPEGEEVAVAAGDGSASLSDLPDEFWSIRSAAASESGVIRFAEDIDEIRNRVARRGRRSGGAGGSRGSGQAARRRTKAGRRR
jgi:N utilization substance protein A